MSSLRNSLHRRNHKERSQLSNRSRLGILEKHKDYVLRAKDYHSKQDRITRLKQKASERNKDEFYFGMTKQTTKGGVHVQERGNSAMPVDLVKVLKTQDENYVRTMRATGLKKIEKLKAQLTALADLVGPYLLDADEGDDSLDEDEMDVLRKAGIISGSKASGKSRTGSKNHILFVDNAEEARNHISKGKARNGPVECRPDDTSNDAIDLGWKVPVTTPGKGRSKEAVVSKAEQEAEVVAQRREEARKHRSRLLKELSARLARDTQLRYAERELTMQRMLMGKGASMKLLGVERVGGNEEEDDEDELDAGKGRKSDKPPDDKLYKPRVYKWRAERKR